MPGEAIVFLLFRDGLDRDRLDPGPSPCSPTDKPQLVVRASEAKKIFKRESCFWWVLMVAYESRR